MLLIIWVPPAGESPVRANDTGALENFVDVLPNRAHAGGFLLSYELVSCGKLFVGSTTAGFTYFIYGIKLNFFVDKPDFNGETVTLVALRLQLIFHEIPINIKSTKALLEITLGPLRCRYRYPCLVGFVLWVRCFLFHDIEKFGLQSVALKRTGGNIHVFYCVTYERHYPPFT